MPTPMISLIARVASSTESNTASSVRTPCGSGVSRVQILVTIASVPSLPTKRANEIESDRVFGRSAELDDRAVGHDRLDRQRVVDGHPVFQRVGAAGVGGHVAADRAGPLARRIGSIMISGPFQCVGQPDVDDAGLDDGVAVAEIDLQNLPHACQGNHHPAPHRQATAGQAGAGSAWQEAEAVAIAKPHDRRPPVRWFRERPPRRGSSFR